VTGLQARTFAVWTALSGVVRLYAAYNINQKVCVLDSHLIIRASADAKCCRIYDLTLFTYLFAFAHFTSELLIFRTASFGPGALSPVLVSSESAIMDSAIRNIKSSDRVITRRRVLNLDDHAVRLLRAVNPRRENPPQHRGNQGVIALSLPDASLCWKSPGSKTSGILRIF